MMVYFVPTGIKAPPTGEQKGLTLVRVVREGYLPQFPYIEPPTGVPTLGQVWPRGNLSISMGGGGGSVAPAARQTTAITTASLANNAQATGTVTLSKSYRLLKLETNVAARIRLYSTVAKRDADLARAAGTDPTGDHGLMFDFVTTTGALVADISPTVDGFDGKATPDGLIPYTITNLSGSSAAVTATLTWISTE